MVAVIVLSPNGEKRILKTGQITGVPTGAAVAKAVRKTKPAEEVGRFGVTDGELLVWGWTEGKKGGENKHILPGALVGRAMYSDIVITYAIEKDLTMEAWEGVVATTQREGVVASTQREGVVAATQREGVVATTQREGVVATTQRECAPALSSKKTPVAKKIDVSPLVEESDSESDSESECSEDEEEVDVEEEVEASDIEDEEESEEEEEVSEAEEEEEEEEEEDDGGSCNDEEDGGGKRRSARRRTAVLQEFRRMEMGLRSRVRFPATPGKRAPRWQTASPLTKEEYATAP